MIRNSFILKVFALAVLAALFASPASAERLQSRISQGNNFGATIATGWGMPFSGSGRPWQFPRGSSNLITNDGMTIGIYAAQDLDGDGTPEDTSGINHLRAMMPALASLESIDLLTALAASGANMEGEPGRTEYNRVWSSLDAEELTDWPIEGRIPRGDPNGAPDVAAGGETMFFHSSDVFNSWGVNNATVGAAYEWTLRFLDFAESNNMMYGNVFARNMSEYCKWNPNSTYQATGQANPDGWAWSGAVLAGNNRALYFGGDRPGWALHAEKQIVGWYGITPQISGFTPATAPLLGFKMINPPKSGDQQMTMTSLHCYTSGNVEFGFTGHKQIFVGFPYGVVYLACLDLETGYYPGVNNPFTGEQVRGAFPGMLQPEDGERYGKWIWGGSATWMHYPCYGELHDVAPRDSVVYDFAYMLTYPTIGDYVRPDLDIANIDDPIMQDLLEPLESYAEIAEIVINSGYKLPETPRAPPLTIIPGDRQVTITWSDVNLQTPDTYYYFLEEQDLNPSGYYREYDFEGFRFYRSFVGPNDSHSELLADFNLSGGNLQFYYIDKREDDKPYRRMRNGMKVWYALVPYDRNYDTATGDMFSLPDPSSGKTWNRPGATLYTVIPRSDASNFKTASVLGLTYVPRSGPGVTPVEAPTADLTGDGSGKLTQAPVYLAPMLGTVELVPINSERITQDMSVYLECTGLGWGGCVYPSSQRTLQLVEGSNTGMPLVVNVRQRADPQPEAFVFNGPVDSDGMNYAVSAEFLTLKQGDFRSKVYYNMDTGGYTEANVSVFEGRCGTGRPFGSQPSILSFTKSARITLTWKDAGGGNLTLEVQDATHGEAVPYGPYFDDLGWGFIEDGEWGRTMYKYEGTLIYELYLPREERTAIMSETFPADNTADFGIWLNGAVWRFESVGDEFTAMPAVGTVMTVDFCMGSWNGDQTVFTMNADPPWPGDKWKIDVAAMSMEPEDADLNRVKVVPNPYMASSFLDLSINNRRVDFVNLPDKCTIRIYTLSGNLVNVLNHIGANRQGWGDYTDWNRLTAVTSEPAQYTGYDNHGGTEPWNLRNRFGQMVASGLYFYHVTDSRGETFTGKFYIIN